MEVYTVNDRITPRDRIGAVAILAVAAYWAARRRAWLLVFGRAYEQGYDDATANARWHEAGYDARHGAGEIL